MRSSLKSIKVPSIPPYKEKQIHVVWRSAFDLVIASLFCVAICLSSRFKKIIQGWNGVQACTAYLFAGSTTPPNNEIRNEI